MASGWKGPNGCPVAGAPTSSTGTPLSWTRPAPPSEPRLLPPSHTCPLPRGPRTAQPPDPHCPCSDPPPSTRGGHGDCTPREDGHRVERPRPCPRGRPPGTPAARPQVTPAGASSSAEVALVRPSGRVSRASVERDRGLVLGPARPRLQAAGPALAAVHLGGRAAPRAQAPPGQGLPRPRASGWPPRGRPCRALTLLLGPQPAQPHLPARPGRPPGSKGHFQPQPLRGRPPRSSRQALGALAPPHGTGAESAGNFR